MYATTYARASKKEKGRILDQVVEVTGWSRDNARRRLTTASKVALGQREQVVRRPRKRRSPKYSDDAREVLQRVWAASGGQSGKYLAASMRLQLDALERHAELVPGKDRYSPAVRAELLAISPATIDRYLAPVKATRQIKGTSATKPSVVRRASIKDRTAGDEIEAEPGFLEVDTVAHCGPCLEGEFVRTLNLTCAHTGWTFTRSIRNNTNTQILAGLDAAVEQIPFEIVGLDFGGGSEVSHQSVIRWAASRQIVFTRSRRHPKNDQSAIESANNPLVRRYAFHDRYDTFQERVLLNRLWKRVDDRHNFLTPIIKPTGYAPTADGRRRRLYDAPATPADRLLAAKVLSPAQEDELAAYRDSLNPAALGRDIADLQAALLRLAKEKAERPHRAPMSTALPDIHHGVRIARSKTAS